MSLFESASLCITPNGTKASKLYAIKPTDGSGDLSVTRATTATRVNSSGLIESVASNVPRLDYSNGSCPSILVEPQRTNLILRSDEFDNASWVKNNSTVTANSIISPDGTTNADTINVTSGFYRGVYQFGNLANNIFTMSVFAKKGTKQWLYFVDLVGNQGVAWFDLNNGTVGNVINGTAKIEDFANGWYRCTYTNPNSIVNTLFQLGVSESNNSNAITSNGNIYLWGAQLEAGSYATSYIPTTSASVTRNADVISKTGISSLIGQTEGTIFVDFNLQTPNGLDYVIGQIYNNSTPANSIYFYVTASNFLQAYVDNSTTQVNLSSPTALSQGKNKVAISYKANNFVFYINGVQIGTDTSGTVPTCDSVNLINYAATPIYLQKSSINQYLIFKTALTNAELAQLTTL